MYNNSAENYKAVFDLILLVLIVSYIIWRKFSLGRLVSGAPDDSLAESTESSAIISYYTAGHNLTSAPRGKLGGMTYSLYATMPQDQSAARTIPYVEDNVAIYALELPFNTQSHFIGLSKEHKLNRIQFESFLKANGMEKVVLEGDFPDYFDIYAAKGQQFQVRYVLDPSAMEFVEDFCRSHFWEINAAELYIVASSSDKEDPSFLTESQKFVDQIKPALLPGEPGAAVVHHEVPYGDYDGPPLLCPICGKTMSMNDIYQACPEGQGILINGRNLARFHSGELQIPLAPGKDTSHDQLTCPNCHNPMVETGYEGSNVMIDSCENCPFRWLDAPEILALNPKLR